MKVLFITSTRIGDAVLSTGLLANLIERHPNARFTIACGPAAAPLFQAVPRLDRVIVMRKRGAGSHWLRLWRATVLSVWDIVVDLRGSILSYLVPARRRIIYRSKEGPAHRVEAISELAGLDPPYAPKLWAGEQHEAEAGRVLPNGVPLLAFGPVAGWRGKQWPIERFTELAQRLTRPGAVFAGAGIVVVGAEVERSQAQPFFDAFPRAIDLMGKIDLLTVYAVLHRARFYVGNDSGLMHIAAAAGVPTLGLFGPSRDEHYAPWGANTAVVRTRESYEDLIERPGYDYRTTKTLMGGLSVDAVEAEAITLWHRATGAAA